MPPKEEPKEKKPFDSAQGKPEGDSGVLSVKFVKNPSMEKVPLPKAVFASNDFIENNKVKDVPEPAKKYTQNLVENEIIKEKSVKQKPEKIFRKMSFKARVITFICILALITCAYFYFTLQKVNVTIWPKTEVLSFKGKITADKSATENNLTNSVIPAKIFESNQDLWQDFPSTGTSTNSGKASGTIRVYNKLNPTAPFVLKSGTHFLSDSGKYFITSASITIPAGTLKSGKVIPGSISVKVTAEEAGKESNIGASKFSIPKLAGTNYYYSIYAESTSAMSGGYSGAVKQVTDTDLANAKNLLSKKVLDLALADLKSKVPGEYVLFDNAILNNVTEAFSPVKSGATVDNFNYQVKVKAIGLAFLRSDIEKFAKDKISSNLSQKTLLDTSFKIDFVPDSVDLSIGKMVLNSDFSARVYQPIDTNDLVSLIKEKNSQEILEIIDSRLNGQVQNKEINFWPFWTTSAPADSAKIKVELKFE